MNKNYNHKLVEKDTERKWRKKKFFINHDLSKKPFSILLPPPNVTGKLHLGHALDSYIPDTIIRYKKLKGFDVMWLPGMDHAGIATQSKVEDHLLNTEGIDRISLGREKFIQRIWGWKEEYSEIFKKQWYKMGLAFDYSNERFTLDNQANQAVQKVFIDLYNKGFLYKGIRPISWDIKLQTAVSNIEVNNEPTEQNMYYIKYKVKETNEDLIIATVRTETLLSDVAVVANPKDTRYLKYKNMHIIHPLTKKELPIVFDDYVDINFGTGLMKLSAHAEADIEIIQKLGLEIIESIDKKGFINYPESEFHNLERFQVRKLIAQYLEKNNYLLKKEKVISNVSVSDRSKTVIETLVLPQWFVKMDKFKNYILDDLKSKNGVKFYPKRLKDTMKQWMEDVHDWTISRQLWWGHRIPAWYKGNEVKVQIKSPGKDWVQDEDVLDTWFSSGIAPFVFLGWPKENELLKRYYPFSLLVTGYDIIFFWVARMYFMSLEFMKEIPFKELLFHGLIRASDGRKMSKSYNNGVDPMELIDEYGSDALRWFLLTNTSPGLDIKFSKEKIESAWRLNNKLWNIVNYIKEIPNTKNNQKTFADKWILNKLNDLSKKIDKSMKKYDFTVIGSEIYKYIFNDLSSWYVEFLKSSPSKKNALNILKKTLIILHPFLPFLTDKLYFELFASELLEQKWPRIMTNKDANYIDELILVISEIRKYREEYNISKKEIIQYWYPSLTNQEGIDIINKLANAKEFQNNDFLISVNNKELFISINQEQKEKNKMDLLNKIQKVEFEIQRAQSMLNNEKFVKFAPESKVQEERSKLDKYTKDLEKYQEELKWKY
ncbi:valine--tRNA ligase [Mycoplasmopsis felis]|uniref:valine--tRNA ligase n=1 Tax=Mycoplasmopsis felis TaxID=33923 RepID=UPI002AFE9E39|nr:valine--tRNA ligase [Mycoplasmopsis felis]WQQ11133.1 valine--tRNA ligase [Mycoplasmopsis felis]